MPCRISATIVLGLETIDYSFYLHRSLNDVITVLLSTQSWSTTYGYMSSSFFLFLVV